MVLQLTTAKTKNQTKFRGKNFDISRVLEKILRDNYGKYIRIFMELQGIFFFSRHEEFGEKEARDIEIRLYILVLYVLKYHF